MTTLNLLDPWRRPGRVWRALCHVVTGLPLGIVTFVPTIVLLALGAGLLVTFFLALPVVWLLFVLAHALAELDRSRSNSLVDAGIHPPRHPPLSGSWWHRLRQRATSRTRWKQVAHHLLLLPLAAVFISLTMAAWCGSIALIGMPAYVDELPGGSAKFWLFEVSAGLAAWAAAAVGAVGVLAVAPWTTLAMSRLQVAMARALLGPSRDEVLAAQVTRLESSRTAAVDSAEAERRRIERDLHDGAQQRLVALAAGLGAARERLADDPEAGRVMVAEAHEEAKAALKEIRDLVRGIHPVILEDRGLDAALSAVVARAPVPVALDVRVDPRPPAAVESAAYFVVNEALTNVARHAQATRAAVAIVRAGDRLVLDIRDDGVGGADASRGTGLQGLRERVAALGGTMHVISPEGGPTSISVELPCGS